MSKKYTSEQFWKLYEKLPQELKDVLFTEETGNNIHDICTRNGIEEKIGEVVDYVGQVLVGVLPPDEFQESLEKDLEIEKEVAKKVAQEINRFIFYPAKPALEELYGKEINPLTKPTKITPSPEEKPSAPERKDTYRESIE